MRSNLYFSHAACGMLFGVSIKLCGSRQQPRKIYTETKRESSPKKRKLWFSPCENSMHFLESATSKTIEHVPHHSLFAAHGLVTHTVHPT